MQNIGSLGRLLRIGSYTAAGSFTWTLQPDVGFIVVEVVGGGGSYTNLPGNSGGTSSFGSHCSATGGAGNFSNLTGASGGSGTGGDINFPGKDGSQGSASVGGSGGYSFLGYAGSGGHAGNGSGGCGAGGYSRKLIMRSSLGGTETVTVGAAGSGGSGSGKGIVGAVIIYEYST